ncbi:MAG TPA: MaoC family dehydratase N-terminal domain-containing protein [Mycobacteriales bacterium]|nr:MaoC family dehydratase N-terminal domain-containing protein [Mycobacteriales bacterium]HWA65694.1 MaoC family dehydratase N-terminal domain-containing protein [Mycobacteriales bacterium]
MPLNRDFIGRSYASDGTFEVGREHIKRFADAIGDPNPIYRDKAAAQAAGHPDVIAPPTFLTTLGFSLGGRGAMADADLGLDYSRVVHGEQKFVHHRPVRPGDELTATTYIDDIRDAGANELMAMRMEIRTTAGELVCEATNVVVSRGTAAGA